MWVYKDGCVTIYECMGTAVWRYVSVWGRLCDDMWVYRDGCLTICECIGTTVWRYVSVWGRLCDDMWVYRDDCVTICECMGTAVWRYVDILECWGSGMLWAGFDHSISNIGHIYIYQQHSNYNQWSAIYRIIKLILILNIYIYIYEFYLRGLLQLLSLGAVAATPPLLYVVTKRSIYVHLWFRVLYQKVCCRLFVTSETVPNVMVLPVWYFCDCTRRCGAAYLVLLELYQKMWFCLFGSSGTVPEYVVLPIWHFYNFKQYVVLSIWHFWYFTEDMVLPIWHFWNCTRICGIA